MRKSWAIGGASLVAAIGVAAAVAVGHGDKAADGKGGKGGKDSKAEVALQFAPAEVVSPSLAPMPMRIEFSGPLVAPSTAVVRAKTTGTLLALNASEGSRVKAGQQLGKVDLAELDSRVAERNAMLESAKAQLAQAERAHESNLRLANEKFISPNALETSRAALETARANLRAAQAQLDTTRVGLRDAALVAPISGIVAKRHVVPGEKLAPEQQVLTIVDLQTLELAGVVGTHEVSALSPGMPVEVKVEGFDSPVHGKIARIAPAAEAGTRSIGVTVTVANAKETFRAGQYAVAHVDVPDRAMRLSVPVNAITSNGGQEQVWVIENGSLVRRAITTGRKDDATGRVEVLKGLTATSQVLAARFDNLHEGSKAVVVNKAAKLASAASGSQLQ